MKKIYMILAAITLLSLSLNAQILLTGWDCATDGQTFPSSWTVPSVGGSGDFTNSYWFSGSSGGTFTIPASALQGNSTVTVKIVAGKENSSTHSISVNGDSKGLTQELVEYVWDNVSATDGLTITYSDYYVDISSIKVYAIITDPTIQASPTSVSMNAAPGGTATETITVTGLNLTDGITYTLTDANGVFSASPASLGTTGGDLTITYSPSAPGNHTATLVLNSTGADPVTIALDGSCVAGTVYELVTDPSTQLVDGKEYILVGKNNQYAMGAISNNYGSAVAITDNGNGTVTVPGTASPLVFTLHSYSSNYTSGYTLETNGNYLRPSSSSSSNLTTATTSNDYTCWSPVADVKSTGGYGLQYSYLSTNRAVAFRESSSVSARFAYYAKSNLTAASTEYYYALLYKKVDNTPELTAPTNGSTVNVGENNGAGVDKTVTVSGRNLTEDLNVSVTGTGFSVSPTTLTAADVNAGTTVTVTYNGTDPTATGTMTIGSNEASVTVNLTATYVDITPVLTAPTTGTTVNVGTNEGAGASTTVTVSGNYLTEALTVTVTGDGFSVSPSSISAADANAGTTVTVTYNGTNPNATGTLTIGSNEVSVTVDLTASYVYHAPELTAPTNNSTVNVGTNTGSGVSKTINIKGNYLTQDLTVSVSGTGFSVSRDVTVTAAEANAGQDITVTYNGTNENATGTLTISSSEVNATVNLTASYSESGEITVANGTDTDMYLPVYGSYYEQVQMNQMIYPASMLSDMEGKYITSITFYPASGTTSGGSAVSGIAFSGGKVMLSLGSTTNNSFTSNTAISATVEQVAEIDDVQADQTLTAWTFTFDTPYLYEGGNLLLQVDTEAGSYYRTFFYGTTMSNMGRHQCSGDGGNALHNFLPKATFTYSSTAPLPPAVEGGLLRLHLLFCDQLKANIPDDNKHPDAYGYVLKFEPQGGETQESGTVKVDIQKTDCEVMGYYTLDQIDRDTNRGLTMDVLTADVQFDLTATNDMLNYYYLQGKENGYPELDKDYLSQLHRQEDFTYREMYEDSYEFDQVFNSGEHHYFNSAAEPIIGQYGVASKFVSYAPSVTTWGIQRRYFELDGKDNTYGAPVWKTAVGKVEMDSQAKPVVERQTNSNNSVNWGSGDNAASLYMLDNVKAIGYLPPTNLTKVEFEPYMFRIFVESKNGLLRPYKVVPAVEGSATEGEHLEAADGELTEADMKGPICVWSGYIKYDNDGNPIDDAVNGVELSYNDINGPFTYLKNKVDRDAGYDAEGNPLGGWDKDSNNAMFGALDALAISGYDAQGKPILNNNITEDDLKIFVRFYYSVKGELADHTVWSRTEGSRSGNGAESGGKAPDPATGVNEIVYHGEIVETIYYNVQGMMSDKPFEGVNIIVNRYSDGTSSVSKVVK